MQHRWSKAGGRPKRTATRPPSVPDLGEGVLGLFVREPLAVLARQLLVEAGAAELGELQIRLGALDRFGVPIDESVLLEVGDSELGVGGFVALAVLTGQLLIQAGPRERRERQV